MAEAVAQAIADQQHLMVEAGTGVGKSFAYLVPAILAAAAEQGVPRRHLHAHHQPAGTAHPQGHPVPADGDAAAVQRRARQGAVQLHQPAPAPRSPSSAAGRCSPSDAPSTQLQQIGRWSRQTQDGSRSDLAFSRCRPSGTWSRATAATAWAASAPTTSECFYFKARRQIYGGQRPRRQSRPVLQRPAPCAGRGAACCPTTRSSSSTRPTPSKTSPPTTSACRSAAAPSTTCSTGSSQPRGRPRPARASTAPTRRSARSIAARRPASASSTTSDLARAQPRRAAAGRRPRRRCASSSRHRRRPALRGADEAGRAASTRSPSEASDEEDKIEFDRRRPTAAAALAVAVEQWLARSWPARSTGSRRRERPQPRIDLASAPIEVGPALREQLYDKVPTVIMTSATLSAGGRDGFDHFQQRLGPGRLRDAAARQPVQLPRAGRTAPVPPMPDPSADPGRVTRRPSLEQDPGVRRAHAAGRSCCSPATR